MNKHIIVIGGGPAGCVTAGNLAREGYRVSIFEKEDKPGGKVKNWYQLFPDRRKSSEVLDYLLGEIDQSSITLYSGEAISELKKSGDTFIVKTDKRELKDADAVVVATGFDLFDAHRKEEYGYGIYENVITSLDLEEKFHQGKILTTKGKKPDRVAIVHCVGSRDEKVGNFHCSKVCCVTAVKQAIEIKEHLPETEVFCFYMDMRMFGPYYEELYREAQEKWNINFIRGKVSETTENIEGRLLIKAEDTLSGTPLKMETDLLVLMVGMENSRSGLGLKTSLALETGVNGFFRVKDNHYANNLGLTDGLFYAGTCTAPMNITDTISHARSAVTEVKDYFKNN